MAALTGEQLDRFHAGGYLPLGALLSAAELESLRRRTDDLTAGRVPPGRIGFQLDERWRRTAGDATGYAYAGPSDGYRKIGGLEWDPVFYPVIAGAAMLEVIGRLVPRPLAIHRAMILMKPAHGGTALSWHQDTGAGFPVPGTPYCTIWTALDDAGPDNGAMYVLPGSQHFDADGLPWQEVTVRARARAAAQDGDQERVVLTAAAGESYLLNPRVLHGSDPNPTGRRRRAMNVIYMPAGAPITSQPDGRPDHERRLIRETAAAG